jgi:pseudouridine synthase
VLDLLAPEYRKIGLFPVGRLDKDTEGLLLLTDDGALAHDLLAPKKHVDKVYFVRTDGALDDADSKAFEQGITLGDGLECLPAKLEILKSDAQSEALITIAKRRLNARQTDSYIEQLLNSPPKAGHRISMVRDVRIFVNTIDHAIRLMTDNGVPATAHREEKDGYIEYTVRIPTAAAEK